MTEQEILDQIRREVADNHVFVFMKGTPEMPRCGFSNQVVQILNHLNVDYGARDVLTDPRTLPGALQISPEDLEARNGEISRDREIVLFCT